MFTFSPAILSYAGANVVAGNVVYPTIGGAAIVWPTVPPNPPNPVSNINFPKANCRQIIVLNTGATTLYFGSIFVQAFADLPTPFNPANPAITPVLNGNCTTIPAGGSLSIELEVFEKRGQFDPGNVAITGATFEPITLIYFSAPPATNASAAITYINTTGPF